MVTFELYCIEEGPAAVARIRAKILGTAAVVATGSAAWAIAKERNVLRTTTALTANTAVAMAAFAVCQEGVRAVRRGDDDAWNSFIAGGLAGAAMTRVAYGRGFHLLGAVMWAPLCGGLHALNSMLQPSATIKRWLASQGLLDLPENEKQQLLQQQEQLVPRDQQYGTAASRQVEHSGRQQQQQQQQQAASGQMPPSAPKRFEDLAWREKLQAVELIKQRELRQLHEQMRQQEAAASEVVKQLDEGDLQKKNRWLSW